MRTDDTLRRIEDAMIEEILSASTEEAADDLADGGIGENEAVALMDRMANEAMTTGFLAHRPCDVVMWQPQPTLEAELAHARDCLATQRDVMEITWGQRTNPRDRLFAGAPECPDVLYMADRIEQLEAIVRSLERRVRIAADEQRRAA